MNFTEFCLSSRRFTLLKTIADTISAPNRCGLALRLRPRLNRPGDEAAWWQRLNIGPLTVALKPWQHIHIDGEFRSNNGRSLSDADCEYAGRGTSKSLG